MISDLTTPLISNLNDLGEIPEEEAHRIQRLFSKTEIPKHHYFVKAGEIQKVIGFNLSGVFRYFYTNYDGEEFNKHFCVDRDWVLSLSALADRSPSLFSIQALEDNLVLTVDAESIYELIQVNPYWQAIYRQLLENNYVKKEKREADFLLNNASGRYQSFLKEYPSLPDRIRQHHIASYLGITPVSLSRIRSNTNSDNK